MIRKLKYIIPAILLITSCKKQLDINTDPYKPISVSEGHLLTGIEKSLGDATSQNGLSYPLEVYMHRITVREYPNSYGVTGTTADWGGFYVSVLTNSDLLIAEGNKNGNLQYTGIGEIIKAYAYSLLVDIYGDVPFSEVNKLTTDNITNPKFDQGKDIYPQLITLLDKGITDLKASATNANTPGADDVIYGGDIVKWEKAANTIKLKMLLQQRLVKDVTADVTALVAGNKLISSTAESFLLPHGPNGATDDRNAGYSEYYASQRTKNISPWFYEILKGYNKNIYTGITDPRIPYYIYQQIGDPDFTGTNPSEYRDGRFLSIYFGSNGPNAGQSQQNYMSISGIYPVGGRYDDGEGGKADASSGTGAAPDRFITYADVLYMEAELRHTGKLSGDAKATLEAAINESFNQVDYVITKYVKPSQAVPTLVGSDDVKNYVADVMAQYVAKPNQQLEQIMTQKWISSFGFAVDAYTDYRRTGFPVIFDPNNTTQAPGGKVQPPVDGNPGLDGPQPAVPVSASKKFPLTFPFPQNELDGNSSAPAQKVDLSTYKPFWLP
nr:SusD/RagB family nutrient-binding outer membrane lipoprotein [Mucilaginibacter sp. L294]